MFENSQVNKSMIKNSVHPIIQKALTHLEKANYREYFEEMEEIIPSSMRTTYQELKKIFILGMQTHNFAEQLGVFASEVNRHLSQKEDFLN